MATQATLASAFTKAAIRFNVSESDYLVLGDAGNRQLRGPSL